ncbi:MAG: DUF6132 family protein [Weeksellaceae bacterium]
MTNYIKKHLLLIIGAPIGALAGFLYWKHIGCLSGSCAITSDPINSTVYGAVMGSLLFSMFQIEKTKHQIKKEKK